VVQGRRFFGARVSSLLLVGINHVVIIKYFKRNAFDSSIWLSHFICW